MNATQRARQVVQHPAMGEALTQLHDCFTAGLNDQGLAFEDSEDDWPIEPNRRCLRRTSRTRACDGVPSLELVSELSVEIVALETAIRLTTRLTDCQDHRAGSDRKIVGFYTAATYIWERWGSLPATAEETFLVDWNRRQPAEAETISRVMQSRIEETLCP